MNHVYRVCGNSVHVYHPCSVSLSSVHRCHLVPDITSVLLGGRDSLVRLTPLPECRVLSHGVPVLRSSSVDVGFSRSSAVVVYPTFTSQNLRRELSPRNVTPVPKEVPPGDTRDRPSYDRRVNLGLVFKCTRVKHHSVISEV